MAKLVERLDALLALPPEELAAVSSELGDVLLHAREEGSRLLREGRDGGAEPLLRKAEALAVAGRRFDAALPLRICSGSWKRPGTTLRVRSPGMALLWRCPQWPTIRRPWTRCSTLWRGSPRSVRN